MKKLAIVGVVAVSPAFADPVPARVCVPTALMDRVAAYLAGQPWRDVAGLMDSLRQEAAKPEPCPEPPPPSKP